MCMIHLLHRPSISRVCSHQSKPGIRMVRCSLLGLAFWSLRQRQWFLLQLIQAHLLLNQISHCIILHQFDALSELGYPLHILRLLYSPRIQSLRGRHSSWYSAHALQRHVSNSRWHKWEPDFYPPELWSSSQNRGMLSCERMAQKFQRFVDLISDHKFVGCDGRIPQLSTGVGRSTW